MFCKNCGKKLNDGAAFCLNCGTKAGNGNSFCNNCGSAVKPESDFCISCGNKVSSENDAVTGNSVSQKNQNNTLSLVLENVQPIIAIITFILMFFPLVSSDFGYGYSVTVNAFETFGGYILFGTIAASFVQFIPDIENKYIRMSYLAAPIIEIIGIEIMSSFSIFGDNSLTGAGNLMFVLSIVSLAVGIYLFVKTKKK